MSEGHAGWNTHTTVGDQANNKGPTMEYLDYYDYPNYNWEIVSSMDGWETHPIPAALGATTVPRTVAISVNRHTSGSEEVPALDAQGRAFRCVEQRAYPWDNWDD